MAFIAINLVIEEKKKTQTEEKKKTQKNRNLRIGTRNELTMLKPGRLEKVEEEMKKNRLDALGLCEVRWEEDGDIRSGKCRFLCSGEAKGGTHGVGIGERLKDKVIKTEFVDAKIIMAGLRGKKKDLVIIQVYLPTSQHPDEEVEETYEKVEEIIREKRGGCVVIMGDWSAVVGKRRDGQTVRKHGLSKIK